MAEQALAAKAWPFEEARKLVARLERRKAAGKPVREVLLETGYGRSSAHAARVNPAMRPSAVTTPRAYLRVMNILHNGGL